jgi:mannan endo-1,4-beta-mannosidase
MKGALKAISALLLITLISAAEPEYTVLPYTIEAEDCEGAGEPWTSIYEKKIKGMFSGKGFAYLTNSPFSFNVTVKEDGMYQFNARVAQILNEEGRLQTISINGIDYQYTIPFYDTWTDFDFGMHRLNKGTNKIQFKPIYGYAEYDTITVSEATFPDFSKVDTKLSDPKATAEAQELQDYLGSVYGKKIISGQQEIYGGGNDGNPELEFDWIKDLTGKYPAIRGFDFMNYNPLYGWDDKTTERVIEWVKTRGGIATASWHINVPKDFDSYNLGDKVDWQQCTYATGSTFKTEDCTVKGTKENDYWNEAIKMLAEQLKRLQDENVPLIFRPLHEAEGNPNTDGSGAWFWWGKAGAKKYVEIWKYLYDKLTKEYDLHNLIWEQNLYAWSPQSLQWYAGDDCVDMVGYDKYNTVYNRHDGKTSGPNLDAETSIFYTLVNFVENKKMVAMAENDSIPGINNLIVEHAAWLYFCPWYGEFIMDEKNNAKSDLKELYTNEYCITLEDLPFLKKK